MVETANAQETDLSELNGTNGFVIIPPDDTGDFAASMANAGDVNGDGIEDLIIGHPRADIDGNSNVGQAFIIYGTTAGMPDTLYLGDLTSSEGVVLNGVAADDQAGNEVTGNFDINNDGYDDVAVSAPLTDPGTLDNAGSVYVVFGGSSLPASIDLDDLDGTNGFRYDGDNADDDMIGVALSPGGDYNDDGIDDLMIGAPLYDDPGDPNSGAVFFIFGQTTAFSSTESADRSFIHMVDGDQHGRSVALIGNFFGDDQDAIAIGQYRAYTGADGETGLGLIIPYDRPNLTGLGSSYGFGLVGEDTNDNLGWSVAGIGDFDQDGLDDVLWGATQADGLAANSGEGYIMYGRDDTGYDFLSVNGKTGYPSFGGTTIRGISTPDGVGDQVAYAGDFNDDGFPDALISTKSADPDGNTSAGEVYLIEGGSRITTINLNNSSRVITFQGTEAGDELGSSIAGLDFNDDGVSDLAMGAEGVGDGGAVYVVFGTPDVEAPLISGIVPLSTGITELRDATDIPADGFEARFTFDESITMADDGFIYLLRTRDSTVVSSFDVSSDLTPNNMVLDITISTLDEYERYSFIIPDSVILDVSQAANEFAGVLNLSAIQFRTEGDAPTLTYGGGYDVDNAIFKDEFDVSENDASPQGMTFSTDGSKMYTSSGSAIDQYSLSTPFDISTADYDGTNTFSGITTSLNGLAFSTDGSKLFLVDNSNDQIVQLSVSTAFDITGTVTDDDAALNISG
ncbi:MAG: integrin alpha, partial [Bacteroidota bacterium]